MEVRHVAQMTLFLHFSLFICHIKFENCPLKEKASSGIGIITFFLKRTISELDVAKQDIAKIKEDYITKEDFFREQGDTRERLNRIMDILLEIKGERNGQGNS